MTAHGGFAIIPTELARTASVSAQAKAVYVALTSHRGEETITLEQLAKEVGTTPDTARRALESLHKRGWGTTLAALAALAPIVIEHGSEGEVRR